MGVRSAVDIDVDTFRRLYTEGCNYKEMAEHFGISIPALRGRIYKHGTHKEARASMMEEKSKEIRKLLKEGKTLGQIARAMNLSKRIIERSPAYYSDAAHIKPPNERNRRIYCEWRDGATRKQLSFKYGLSYSCVAEIIAKLNTLQEVDCEDVRTTSD